MEKQYDNNRSFLLLPQRLQKRREVGNDLLRILFLFSGLPKESMG